ncbi:MAG: hypothetical protein DI613_17280 [Kocuria rhizophila]|nr:MAG: hypothetical protein DI613_17280 [Kocuria rhizophila]
MSEMASIKEEVTHYSAAKAEVEIGAGEDLDMKQYEAGMRQLLDSYIHATPVEQVADLDKSLIELVVERGADAIGSLPRGIRGSGAATSETIINNVRKTIVDEHAMNPRYYDRMSELLDALIEKQREEALDYATFLNELIELTKKLGAKGSDDDSSYPEWARTPDQRAIIDFSFMPEDLPVDHHALYKRIHSSKDHGWADGGTGSRFKERALARELREVLPGVQEGSLQKFIDMLKNHAEYH